MLVLLQNSNHEIVGKTSYLYVSLYIYDNHLWPKQNYHMTLDSKEAFLLHYQVIFYNLYYKKIFHRLFW